VAGKDSTLTIRMERNLKKALREAAEAEHRSVSNMVEILVRDHCKKAGIAIQPAVGDTKGAPVGKSPPPLGESSEH
jgi:hypothetical protein